MSEEDVRKEIVAALGRCGAGDLRPSAIELFAALGYGSERAVDTGGDPAVFLDYFRPPGHPFAAGKALYDDWLSADVLFQLTDDDIRRGGQIHLFDSAGRQVDRSIMESYLFLAVDLRRPAYSRAELAGATREINKLFTMPAFVLFRHGRTLTPAVINRRLNLRHADRDVLEKVTLIKDIRAADPHRAHVEILHDLALDRLAARHGAANFVELHAAWRRALDSSELNKRFFREIADWYFWAVDRVAFPDGAGPDETRNPTSVIRLLTRLIFVWFMKEKGLVPDELFDRRVLDGLLTWDDPQGSTFYKAVLQNLFFATLNQPMGDGRRFRGRGNGRSLDAHYGIHNVYRYEQRFTDPDRARQLLSTIPFLNGGLFECLDRPAEGVRIDGFSDRADNPLRVPDELFFGDERAVDLNEVYDTRGRRYSVRGLIHILNRYKFTIDENTPIEEDVALDPELLGKVLENLLAAYNPETNTTARKATGSFYTPREIVNYMVDEALAAYLEGMEAGPGDEAARGDWAGRARGLLAYNDAPHGFSEAEVEALIAAVDGVKILDPACGSGAFPMGILHKLVFLLGKLDPDNERWKERQLAKAAALDDPDIRRRAMEDVEATFARNKLDYARKLYLIENCIFGVDIQPIAVQIAKLRFFISLAVDQRIDDDAPNRGILPLPNLETKFVAANTLLGIERPKDEFSGVATGLRSGAVVRMEAELGDVRHRYFTARTPAAKSDYRRRDTELRAAIAEALTQTSLSAAAGAQLAHWNPYDQNAVADFFDAEWMFGLKDGFDVVIGNPPYVRADSGYEHLRYREAIVKSNRYKTLSGKWDLFIPFIELGYQLLKSNGVTIMIVSDAYCHAKYAKKSQTWFLKNARIERLDFLSEIKVFDAAVRNMTYLFRKADGSNNIPLRRLHKQEFGEVILLPSDIQSRLTHRVFFPEDENEVETRANTVKLEEICYVAVGMVVNAHEKLAAGAFSLVDVVSDVKDDIHIKPFVEGKHLDKWLPREYKWLEWGTYRAPSLFRRPTFPELYQVGEKILVQRSPGPDPKACYDDIGLHYTESTVGFIPWISLRGVRNKSLQKVAWYRGDKPERSDLPQRENLEQISAKFQVKYLLAIVNSKYAQSYLRANRRSNIHLYPNDWKQLPVPVTTNEKQDQVVGLVDQILQARKLNSIADVEKIERQIDELVYDLYGLTDAEIALIEGRPDDAAGVPPPAGDDPAAAAAPLLFTGQAPTGSFTERKAAVERLARDGTPAAAQHLAAALGDADAAIRFLAAAHLRRMGRPVAPVVRAFRDQTDDPIARREADGVLASTAEES